MPDDKKSSTQHVSEQELGGLLSQIDFAFKGLAAVTGTSPETASKIRSSADGYIKKAERLLQDSKDLERSLAWKGKTSLDDWGKRFADLIETAALEAYKAAMRAQLRKPYLDSIRSGSSSRGDSGFTAETLANSLAALGNLTAIPDTSFQNDPRDSKWAEWEISAASLAPPSITITIDYGA